MAKKQSRRSEFIKFYDDAMRKGMEEFGWDWYFGNKAAIDMMRVMEVEVTGDNNWQERAMTVCTVYAVLRAEKKFRAGTIRALANEFIEENRDTIITSRVSNEDVVRSLDAFCDWMVEKSQEKES